MLKLNKVGNFELFWVV